MISHLYIIDFVYVVHWCITQFAGEGWQGAEGRGQGAGDIKMANIGPGKTPLGWGDIAGTKLESLAQYTIVGYI